MANPELNHNVMHEFDYGCTIPPSNCVHCHYSKCRRFIDSESKSCWVGKYLEKSRRGNDDIRILDTLVFFCDESCLNIYAMHKGTKTIDTIIDEILPKDSNESTYTEEHHQMDETSKIQDLERKLQQSNEKIKKMQSLLTSISRIILQDPYRECSELDEITRSCMAMRKYQNS